MIPGFPSTITLMRLYWPKAIYAAEALPLTQTILDAFRSNDIAVYNANYAQDFCAKNIGTTSSGSASATPGNDPNPMKVIRRRTLFHSFSAGHQICTACLA